MKTALQILIDARALIEKPEKWTKETFARDADNTPCLERSISAVCWCALGAISRSAPGIPSAIDAKDALRRVIDSKISKFNDEHTHAEVLAAFDKAIEAERGVAHR